MVDVISPYTKESIASVSFADETLVNEAIQKAASAQKEWATVPLDDRIALMGQVGEKMNARHDDFVYALMLDGGASGAKANAERGFGTAFLTHDYSIVKEVLNDRRTTAGRTPPSTSEAYVIRKPIGVAAMICPFNYPLALTCRTMGMALVCGNSFVWKPSPNTTMYANVLQECFDEAGLPAGVSQMLHGGAEVANQIIKHPLVGHVTLVGSSSVGAKVAATCASNLKPSTLELGGKSPLVILDDADLENAISNAFVGLAFHSGQTCIAPTRVLCHDSLAESYIGAIKGAVESHPYGMANGEGGLIGPLINEAAVDRCDRMVQDALSKGAKILAQQPEPPTDGFYFPMTILGDVSPEMEIYDEEAFGPIGYVKTFSSDEEAIALVNASKYGLSAAVHSTDLNRAAEVVSQLEAGSCTINGGTFADDGNMPFGGMKKSGFSRQNNREEVEAFTIGKTVWVFPEGRKFG